MGEWNFMDYASKDRLLGVVRAQADQMLEMCTGADRWEAPTAAGHWQVRDVVGHMVDTTEGYFAAFDAGRSGPEVAAPLGVREMARHADAGAQAFRGTPQDELLDRLRQDLGKMLDQFETLGAQEWGGFTAPHKYMGPLPASFYPIFQLVDYAVHGWDIREGTGRSHVMAGDAADLLVPVIFILWSAIAECPADGEPFDIGIRVTSGANVGDTIAHVRPDGCGFEPGDVSLLPATLEFDPAALVLTSYGRVNGGNARGDTALADRFVNSFFRI